MLCECVLCMPGQRWGGSECFTSQALARLAEGAGDHVWACLRLLLPSHTQTLELAQARSHAGLPLHPPVLRWRYTKADTSSLGRAKMHLYHILLSQLPMIFVLWNVNKF